MDAKVCYLNALRHLGPDTTLVWDDGYFGPIRYKSDDVRSGMSALTNQK